MFIQQAIPYTIIIPIIFGVFIFIFNKAFLLCKILNILTPILLFTYSCITIQYLYIEKISEIYYNMGNFNQIIGIRLKLDYFSAFGLFFISFLHLLNTSLQNFKEMKNIDITRLGFINIMIGGLCGMILTDDLFNLYVFVEIVSIVSYILSINKWNRKSYPVALEYLIVGSIASCFILFSIGFAYANFGTLNITEIHNLISEMFNYGDLIIYSMMFGVIGFLIKTGIYPFHGWYLNIFKSITPSTMCLFSYASSQIAILVIVKLIYMLYGIQFMNSAMQYFYNLLILMGIASIIFGSIKAIFAKTLVGVMVWSSVSQVGYLMMGFVSDNDIIVTGSLMQIFANALSKILIFRIYQKMVYASGLNNLIEIKEIGRFDFSGIRMPLLLILINLAGLPMAIGFMAKIYMVIGFVSEEKIGSFIVILFSSILSVVYIFRIIDGVIIGNKPGLETNLKFYKIKISLGEKIIYIIMSGIIIFSPFVKCFNQYIKVTVKYILNS